MSLGRSHTEIRWLGFPVRKADPSRDREFSGMEFLPGGATRERELWRRFWPQRGQQPSWDAVGEQNGEFFLVEAKANIPEFCSPPSLAKGAGRATIAKAMEETKRHLGVHRRFNWLASYYQYANRVAVLYFLNQRAHVPARLVFVYFTGDHFPDECPCPASQAEWLEVIRACHVALGLPRSHPLGDRIREVFLPRYVGSRPLSTQV
jgi:hypothetical protein